jgi:hypothetical protein
MDLRKKFDIDYEKYIAPYNKEIGIECSKSNIEGSYSNWINTFVDGHCDLVQYDNVDWYNTQKYIISKSWHTKAIHRYLGETSMRLLLSYQEEECQRRCRQIIELACDLYKNPVQVYPVRILPTRVHPGNTLLHALSILNKGCTCIVSRKPKQQAGGKFIKRFTSIDDIQQSYDKPIYAFFIGIEKMHGLQVIAKWGNFNKLNTQGNLHWHTDEVDYPFHLFLDRLVEVTADINGKNCWVSHKGNIYKFVIPRDKKLHDKVWQGLFQWGSENICVQK